MPVSSFFGLQTSLRGLLAQQRALDVTGHNITNAGTAGYSRQEAVLSAAAPLVVPTGATANGGGGALGSGVDVLSYERVRDGFLDVQFRGQQTVLGDRAATTKGLERAELALAEPGDAGIAAQLATFWNAWSDVANTPESPAARQALIGAGTNLAGAIAALDAQFARVGADAAAELAAVTGPGGEIDVHAGEIQRLNEAIIASYETGTTPNDLLDRRDVLLDKLSALGRTTVTEIAPRGSIQVDFGGQPLVVGPTRPPLPASYTSPGGRVGALQQVSQPGGTIAQYRADLESFADGLRTAVNGLHPGFFDPATSPAASTLTVLATTATLQPGATSAPGDNSVALQVARLRGGTPDSTYASLVTRIGGELRSARREEANAEALTRAVEDRRQSVAGVSMDEEMANLVRFQRGYQASARALSTMDEVLDVLINRTGRVGL